MGESRREASQGGEVCRAPQGIAVLVQGAFDSPQGRHRVPELDSDRRRQNYLVLLGWTILRFSWSDVTKHPESVLSSLLQALAA